MFLYIRMLIYAFAIPVAVWLGAEHDPEAGVLIVPIDALINAIAGVVTIVGTFITSRFAKVK